MFFEWEVIRVNSSYLCMRIFFDWITLLFIGGVLCISSMVIYYRNYYMLYDLYRVRFLYIVLLFVFSIILLILRPNLVSILLGWDGLGLVSYCLVIYYSNPKSYSAGILTVLTNRIGDVGILLRIAWFINLGSWNYIYYLTYFDNYSSTWIFYLIIISAFTKSAQIPFSSWLPAAIAAPTPVSALVHSSTLVTAGVYLLIRFSDFLYLFRLDFFLIISCLTIFMSGLAANFEYDLKKIIALSTLSQLGLIISILFIGFSVLSYFHILTHAFFKALIFLCAGLIIHCINDSQDIRYMGYLINCIPFTCSCFCVSRFSLCGFPFLSGFYRKDLILEIISFRYFNLYIYVLFYLSIGLTVSYRLRLIYYCFGGYNGLMPFQSYSEDFVIISSIIFITLFSVVVGRALVWLIFPFPIMLSLPFWIKIISLIFVLLGGVLGYRISLLSLYDNIFGLSFIYVSNYLGLIWFMPYFRTYMIYNKSFIYSRDVSYFMDSGWGEYLISNSLINLFNYLSSFYVIFHFNNVKFFIISFMLLAFLLLIIYFSSLNLKLNLEAIIIGLTPLE